MKIETKPSDILASYFDAGYPVVAVETCEEQRLLEDCKERWGKNKIFSIAASGGLRDENSGKVIEATSNFSKSFGHLTQTRESFLVVFDFQHMINSASAYRPLLQVLSECKSRGSMIILVAPTWNIPPELKHEVPVLSLPLPSPEELEIPLKTVTESAGDGNGEADVQELTSAARGLTLAEAENVFALASLHKYSKDLVEREKMRLVKSGCMSVEKPTNPASLAGLGQLKSYVTDEVLNARDDEQLRVRGIMLVGVPGVGKSLSAKVIASILGWPLVRFDVSAAKGSLVGQSESNIRNALATADAVSPCVLWIDEIEKAVGGYSSSGATDGGTTLAMVGTLLTWMQEHTSAVMVVATCNDFSKLPPELTRAGRFDERFFLDLPSIEEREAIASVHLKSLKCDPTLAKSISVMTPDWTGAEIEQLIKSAARRTKRKLTQGVLTACAEEIIPISKTASIKQLREWAATNLRKANDAEVAVAAAASVKRKVGRHEN